MPRRSRADELLARLPARLSPGDAVDHAIGILRDRSGLGDRTLSLGDRSAINALIATHGVVMDSLQRVLWVSESPHLLGRFVAFDLKRMLAPDYDPEEITELAASAEDPLLTSVIGTSVVVVTACWRRVPSYENIQKSLSFPLYSPGRATGPPAAKPN